MSEKRVCRLHGLVLTQCRCPCPEKFIEIDCNTHCPQYGQPETNALAPLKADLSIARWKSLAERQEKELDNLRSLFRRVWRCEVNSSGYHNGCRCDPEDPHSGWNCDHRWVAPALTEEQARKLGIIE
jgi:hypothetical protein